MTHKLHNSSDYLKLKNLVKDSFFGLDGKEREGGYFTYKYSGEVNQKIAGILKIDCMLEILKVRVPSGKIIKAHFHNSSTEYFFGMQNFEIIINNNPVIIDSCSVLEIPPKCIHESFLQHNDYEFFVIQVRHNNNPNDKEVI